MIVLSYFIHLKCSSSVLASWFSLLPFLPFTQFIHCLRSFQLIFFLFLCHWIDPNMELFSKLCRPLHAESHRPLSWDVLVPLHTVCLSYKPWSLNISNKYLPCIFQIDLFSSLYWFTCSTHSSRSVVICSFPVEVLPAQSLVLFSIILSKDEFLTDGRCHF